ncbi:unnamed protein product [Vitrella brassicaformis CCMP3155]|uniref:Uncharacterized protein n=2 Tax=Vitrella brassicaformis TaxID=1169539 RepID=A0A0G4E9T7_VITBC|nr:unnamed protein product [Vitrella brassicaformis CCMP3155]|mmetsp:Transcript_31726/g.78622  ORF Transcript_31726/g.78622 Transcript_31726/m.78622 type:complete len:353 (+) Transcript_31726:198-1256(+)|eukprot:CEL91947.1 unnamed protein product [Vitrella brassicaformis CCMP3155]
MASILKPIDPDYTQEQKEVLQKQTLNIYESAVFTGTYAAIWAVLLGSLHFYSAQRIDPAVHTNRAELYFFEIACYVLGTVVMMELFPMVFTIVNILKHPDHAHLHFKLKVSTVNVTIVSVIMTSYIFLANDMVPAFLDPVVGRRVYGGRFIEWTMAAPMYTYLTGRLIFNQPLSKVLPPMVITAIYLQMGLWAAVFANPLIRWGCVYGAYIGYFASAYYLARFTDGVQDKHGDLWVKKGLLYFTIVWWGSYGIFFHLAQLGILPSEGEQLMYTAMDSVAKMITSICLISLRSAEWDILLLDARHAAEMARRSAAFETQLQMLKLQLNNQILEGRLAEEEKALGEASGARQRK